MILFHYFLGVIGLVMAIYGIYSAFAGACSYWYSFFVIGSFAFFDLLDFRINCESNIGRLLRGRWTTFVGTYILYLFCAVAIDLYGTVVSGTWVYPHFDLKQNVLHVVIIGYPFAFFSVSALYRCLHGLFAALLNERSEFLTVRNLIHKIVAWALVFALFLSLVMPLANYLLFGNRHANKVGTLLMIMGTFSFSPITFLLFKRSLLLEMFVLRKSTLLALLITWGVSALSHEIPNTFVWEWKYQNIPFTSTEILQVSLIVLTFGWLFLSILGISGNEFL